MKIIRFFPIPTTSDGCDWFVFVDYGKINQPYLEVGEIMDFIKKYQIVIGLIVLALAIYFGLEGLHPESDGFH